MHLSMSCEVYKFPGGLNKIWDKFDNQKVFKCGISYLSFNINCIYSLQKLFKITLLMSSTVFSIVSFPLD